MLQDQFTKGDSHMKGNFVFGLLMILVLTMGAVSAAPVAAALAGLGVFGRNNILITP